MITVEVPNREICPKDANGIANTVDPDQTALERLLSDAPLGAI